MKCDSCLRIGLLALGIAALSGIAYADLPISGNPATDGWRLEGNSLAPGTYIRGTAGFSFDVYNHVFTLGAAEGTWQAGDQVVGLGGITTLGQFIYSPNLVAKFGSSTSVFSASTLPSPGGNGAGSFSSGNAGTGGVQVDFNYEFDNGSGTPTPNTVRPGLAGTILTPDHVLYNGPHQFADPLVNAACNASFSSNACGIDRDFARVKSVFSQNGSGQDVLQSFEVILNLSFLQRNNYSAVPLVNGRSDMGLQTYSNEFTDALVNSATPLAAAVPEPETCAMMLAGLALVGAAVRRRNRSAA